MSGTKSKNKGTALYDTKTPLILAATSGAVEVSSYVDSEGNKFCSNADFSPHAITDGKQMQATSSDKVVLTKREMSRLVNIGTCPSCNTKMVASASTADPIEIAGTDIHCVMCSAEFKPSIKCVELSSALAAEYTDEDMDDADGDDATTDMDDGGDMDDSEGNDSDVEDDMGDDSFDDSDDEDVGDDTDPDMGDDTDPDMDDEEEASLRSRLARRKRAKIKALGSDEDDSDEDEDDSDEDCDKAVASLRKEMAKLGIALADESDENEDQDDEDEDMDKAVASLRKEMAKFGVTAGEDDVADDDVDADEDEDADKEDETAGVRRTLSRIAKAAEDKDDEDEDDEEEANEMPVAGARKANPKMDKIHLAARDRIRAIRGNRADGNAHMKSSTALAEDEMLVDPLGLESEMNTEMVDGETPGTKETVVNKSETQPETPEAVPGVEEPVADVDGATPGTSFDEDDVSSLAAFDWKNAKVEVVASTSSEVVNYVFANGKPAGRLDRNLASANVQAQWGTPVVAKAFLQACTKGLSAEEAKEFGFKANTYRIDGSEVIRHAIRNANTRAQASVKAEVAASEARIQQSVKTAFLGVLKGSWSDSANPMRDALIAAASAVGVAEPRSMIDTALSRTVDTTLASVFAKAKELESKPDVARNEVATFVAQGSYQGRVGVAEELSARLEKGNAPAVVAGVASEVAKEITPAAPQGVSAKLAGAISKLGRHR
jgi:transcription elongation factor Elf1